MPLTKTQIKEIKTHLENAQNPLFLFDNDQDGLCSFLLLQRYVGRGKGFPIKGSPDLSLDFFRKVHEFNSDYIFVLDKPEISKEFFEESMRMNIPLVWIDHHEIDRKKVPAFAHYYNPMFNKKKTDEPVTYLCWEIVEKIRKEDMWLAVAGCVSDHYFPEFYSDFKKNYPELSVDRKDSFDIFYGSEIGKIARLFGFGLKDKTSNVIQMMKFLMKVRSPQEVLYENKENKIMHKRFTEVGKKYDAFVKKARAGVSDTDKYVFFKYAGDTSMSSEIANYLSYLFPDKYIIVAYTKNSRVNISARGEKVRDKLMKIISFMDNATGGGHENAVGAQIDKDDLGFFEERVKEVFG